MKRWLYHLRIMGLDALWIPLAVTAGFVLLVATGGERIRNPSALTLWSELILPALAALLAGFASSPSQDVGRPLLAACRNPAWHTYLERALLLLGFDLLLSLVAGWAITALALPAESALLAIHVTLVSLPVLLVFTFLPLVTAELVRSGPGGAAAGLALWLFFLLNRNLADRLPWQLFYPFLSYTHRSSELWEWNRLALALIGAALLAFFAIWLRRHSAGLD